MGKNTNFSGQPNNERTKRVRKLLYMMDSTTISLFDNILKGVGRHPKSGKKKGGMKVHTLMKYVEGVPMVVNLLCTVMERKIKRHCAFSQIVTMLQQTLMYYIDFLAFMENPNRGWQIISEEYANPPPEIVQLAINFE
jgi:hypothetical protein